VEISEGVKQYGCTIYSMNGFPGDANDQWTKGQLEQVQRQINALGKRAYLCSLSAHQTKARKMLEDAGFKIMAVTYSAHIDFGWDGEPNQRVKQWKENKNVLKDPQTIFLMGRNFYALKRRKKA
jgi:hypothetical protein